MRVRCERAVGDGWPVEGEEYVVLELLHYAGAAPVLRLLGPDAIATRLCDAAGFAVVADAVPLAWSARLDAQGTLTLGPARWREPGFWGAQLEQVPDALAAFLSLRDELLAEDARDRDAAEPTLPLALGAPELDQALDALGDLEGLDAARLRARLRDARASLDDERAAAPAPAIAGAHAEAALAEALSDDPRSTAPFADALRDRLVLFPLDGALLGRDLLAAVAAGAAACGEREAYLRPHRTGTLHRVRLSDWLAYAATVDAGHALVSPTGGWAVVTGEDGSGAAAGEPPFTAALRRWLPHGEPAMLDAFLAEHARVKRRGGDVAWVERFLAHLYGRERAARLAALLG